MKKHLLLKKCERELYNSSQEVSEVLIEHERLYTREYSEGELFENFLEPYLFGNSAINLSAHYFNIINIKGLNSIRNHSKIILIDDILV